MLAYLLDLAVDHALDFLALLINPLFFERPVILEGEILLEFVEVNVDSSCKVLHLYFGQGLVQQIGQSFA